MNYKYSKTSLERLKTAEKALQETFQHVLLTFDHTILQGYRGEDEQNYYFKTKRSKLPYPKSKHNAKPSMAIDAAPWPIDWDDTRRFCYFGGLVVGTGAALGHKIRWGGNWDMDGDIMSDQTFQDLVHFEYLGPL